MRKGAIIFLAVLIVWLPVSGLVSAKPVVAVMPFEINLVGTGHDAYWLRYEGQQLLQALQEALTDRLIESGELWVLERSRLEQVLSELRFQSSDWVDPRYAARLASVLGAQYLIFGTLSRLDADTTGYVDAGDVILRAIGADVELRARIVEVQTSIAVASVTASRTVRSGQLAIFAPYPISASFKGESILNRAIRESLDELTEQVIAVFRTHNGDEARREH